MTQLEWFRFFASEFSSLSDDQVNALLAAASLFVALDGLDEDRANAATALYAAHMQWLKTYRQGGEATHGSVSSEREGDLSRSYNMLHGSDSWLGQSPYGLQFLEIVRAITGSTIMTRFSQVPGGQIPVMGDLGYYSSTYGPARYGN